MSYRTSDVTIIIPAYCETEESLIWLEDCIDSAQEQGCQIVVVDDASPILTEDIVLRRNVTYARLVENKGVSYTRNRAVELADTDLIFPLDSDDTLRSGAIKLLLEEFDGRPTYPDVAMFGDREDPHYRLLNFDCDIIYEKVGIASVNVLHKKEQWNSIYGWREDIDFYEDGEYNARLMLKYCAIRYPVPLVNYRIHARQRTKKNKKRAAQQARTILDIIRGYEDMGCCGNRRNRIANPTGVSRSASREGGMMNTIPSNMPGSKDGRILALYVGGKGSAKHYYRGKHTNYPYKVLHGNHYYVDPLDVKDPDDRMSTSLFVKVVREEEPKKEPVKVATKTVREPRKAPEKQPVESTDIPEKLPDIRSLKWYPEIRYMDFTPEVAAKLLKIEEGGKGRVKVLAHLKKYADKE